MLKSGRLRTVATWLFGTAYCVLFAEAFLRMFAPVAVFPRYVTAAPYGVRVNEPNRQYWHTSPDVSIQIRTNSKGIRCDDAIEYEHPLHVQRIAVLGDSFAMGYEATLEGMFTTHMANSLQADGINVQVVNLAVSGHSNAEELIVFAEEGKKYKPDLVLLCWHASDLSENVRSGLFELNGSELVRKNETYLPGVAMQQRLNRIPGFEWMSSHSQLYSWVRESVAVKIAKPALLFWQEMNRTKESDSGSESINIDYANILTRSLLVRIRDAVCESGAKFMVLDIPSFNEKDEALSNLPVGVLEDGVPVVSPIRAFQELDGSKLYHKKSHRHFTPLACRVVGDLLAREIRDRGMLSSTEETPLPDRTPHQTILGDRTR